MPDPLLVPYSQRLRLCNNCDHAFRIKLHLPTRGSESATLRTGRLLTDSETEHVEDAIQATDDCVGELLEEISTLEGMMLNLRRAVLALQKAQTVQRAYLASIRKLPIELLSQIFEMACCDETIDLSRKRCMPLALSGVCKAWRDTLLSMHGLWTGFVITRRGRAARSVIARLETFLRNSGDMPLRHCVQYEAGPSASPVLGCALKVLLNHTHRWTSMDVFDAPPYAIWKNGSVNIFNGLFGRPLSCLTTLTGRACDLSQGDEMGVFRIPTLRRVTLEHSGDIDVAPDLPWEQLEELTTLTSPQYALNVLLWCTNLAAWKHDDRKLYNHAPAPNYVVVLPHLRSLSIHTESIFTMELLERLDVHSLQDVFVRLYWRPGQLPPNRNSFSVLLARSSCQLRCLELNSSTRADQELIGAQRELNTLRLQGTREHPLTRGLIDALSVDDGTGAPRMRALEHLQLVGIIEADAPTLVKMVEMRRSLGHGLHSLSLGLMSRAELGWNDDTEMRLKGIVPRLDVEAVFS
ncbi:hypothetical protein BD626DRAFT_568241 [Schizophyllum amplum]|uniref:F-box domain-containing protein n=1 Tax=Schizophyllum amplum TaxID=97359 RepID=A0A550CI66_9AGAR|nr:hypothetical protein BD626DRAFT_568241 [Auriculariopsis ampla]